MRRICKTLSVLFVMALAASGQVYAQYMPVVFDKRYGENNKVELVCPLAGDEAALIGKEGRDFNLVWTNRDGEVLFTLPLTGFTAVSQLTGLDNGRVLIVGQSNVGKRTNVRKDITLCGRALMVNREGHITANIYTGVQGSELLKGALLKNGAFMLAGKEPNGRAGQGFLTKVDDKGNSLYLYRNAESGYCAHFEVLGADTEYVCAAFSAGRERGKAVVVRLDDKGKPYYITPLPAARFEVTALSANLSDGSVILTGNTPAEGGMIYKIRPEGDIVFGKTFIPATAAGVRLNHLNVARNGNILLGGSGGKGYYALLRNDGTPLYSNVTDGAVTGVNMNPVTGEAVVATYNSATQRGSFVRISSTGKAEFGSPIEGCFDHIKVFNNGDALFISSSQGRISLYSATGHCEFDRFITDNRPIPYREAVVAASGEVLFLGSGSRLLKLGHGLYVSDVKITKPVGGTATAVFSVTLTGYATTPEGASVPVSVDYATREGSASETNNFTPVSGKLSFTPSPGAAERYLVRQDIEVPVKANNLIEGVKEFELCLSGVSRSYLVKPSGKAVIEDQQAIVKLVRTENGVEGSKDILYELGLFKTDGTPLINATGANIIVDGMYGEGTADALDFDMGFTPRTIFANGAQHTSFGVKTLEDLRYELSKTVVVNFNRIYSLSGSNVGFAGESLSCSGSVVDQPAMLAIASLGDHRANNNAVSGFFAVSLLRASDGALQTNTTGVDIIVNCAMAPDASAREGRDFVFTNLHDLRISGDGNHSSANVNGVVLYNADSAEKQVKLQVKSVTQPGTVGARPIGISPEASAAAFNIRR